MSIKDFKILSIDLENNKKELLNINPSIARKYKFIFNSKEKENIINQCNFYKNIYYGLKNEEVFEVVINKYLKQKLYNVKFPEMSKEYKKFIKKR